jgi:hypothetical protein
MAKTSSQRKPKARTLALPKSSSQIIFSKLTEERFRVFPSAVDKVNQVIKRSKKHRTITSDGEASLVAAAFFSAAAEEASEAGVRKITVKYLDQAWDKLAMTGNCPPHKCVRRSIIQRRDILEKEMPMFRALTEEIKDS